MLNMPKENDIHKLVEEMPLVPLDYIDWLKRYRDGAKDEQGYMLYLLHQAVMNLTRLAVTNALILEEMVKANEEEYEDVEP
jgi:hypothetical protein